MENSWQTDRGQINHNWLQNGVLVALNHAMRLLSGSIRANDFRRTLSVDIPRWQERREELSVLLERFENEMSPKVFFGQVPLCRCSDETKEWLIPLTHELWMKRENVKEITTFARDAYQAVDREYKETCSALAILLETPVASEMDFLSERLRGLIVACENLARAISAFPHEIRCV